MNGPYIGGLMIVAAALTICVCIDRVERRRLACDGCRVEALGSSTPFTSHSCSKSRAHYRDRKGRVFSFGFKVKGGDPR